MKESIYLDTSVVSYHTSKPSRDIIVLAHQEITRQWWHKAVKRYDVFISEVVIEEMAKIYMERLDIPEELLEV